MTRIEQFGWRGAVGPGIGRVVSAHGDYYHLVCNEQPTGEILARKKKSAFMRRKALFFFRAKISPVGCSLQTRW